MRTLNFYRIHYPTLGITQTKVLIPQIIHNRYAELMREVENKEQEGQAKEYLNKHTFGHEYFTTGSAMFRAIKTGILDVGSKLQPACPCIVKPIKTEKQ